MNQSENVKVSLKAEARCHAGSHLKNAAGVGGDEMRGGVVVGVCVCVEGGDNSRISRKIFSRERERERLET